MAGLDGRLHIETKRIAELLPAPYNPRDIEPTAKAALERSLRRFGLVQPIVWNTRSGHVVGGHQKLKILAAAGLEDTDVVVVDLDDLDEKALNLALNSQAITGVFTDEADALLLELREALPDAYDELLLWAIKNEQEIDLEDDDGADAPDAEPEYDLSPDPYESYNYVVLLFRNDIDWTAALDHFGLKRMRGSYAGEGKPKIGLGRALDGGEYIAALRKSAGK